MDVTYITTETALDLTESLLVGPSLLRHLHGLPPRVELPLFSAELHLVHQVVARRILAEPLYSQVVASLGDDEEEYQDLLQLLRPCLASWAYYYALPNIHLLLHDPALELNASQLNQHLDDLRRSHRHQAELWTQQVVDHLLAQPDRYPGYKLSSQIRTYLGTAKVMF